MSVRSATPCLTMRSTSASSNTGFLSSRCQVLVSRAQSAAQLDPNLPLYSVRTFDDIRREYLASRRFAMLMMGSFGALAATQLAASMLYGVAPRDPLTFSSVVALLALVAVGAAWLPARRATRVDPIVALRAE